MREEMGEDEGEKKDGHRTSTYVGHCAHTWISNYVREVNTLS